MWQSTLWGILLVAGSSLIALVQAQPVIYRWTDQQGQVQYSELPPPPGTPYETVRKLGGAALQTEGKDLAKEQEELAKKLAEEEAKTRVQQEEAKKQADAARAKNCEIARKNVELLQTDRPVTRVDAQGNKVVLTAEQRTVELQKAKKDQDYFCNP